MKIPPFLHRSHRSSRHGFTLMEMIIVLSIIALLMGMVIFQIGDFGETAKEKKVQGDLLTFNEMLAGYQLESGVLPTTDQGLKALWVKPTVEPVPDHWRPMLQDEVLDPWNHPYIYRNPGKHNPTKYDLFSPGPDGQPDTDDDIGNWKAPKSTTSP
jgi:general secretion pathway protein G